MILGSADLRLQHKLC